MLIDRDVGFVMLVILREKNIGIAARAAAENSSVDID